MVNIKVQLNHLYLLGTAPNNINTTTNTNNNLQLLNPQLIRMKLISKVLEELDLAIKISINK
jgi:hypothetical protein